MGEEKKASPDLLQYVYDREMACKVCDSKFVERTVKQRALQVAHVESDLRSVYKYVDPLLYEVVLCPHCGYAALSRTFDMVTERQGEAIISQVSPSFVKKQYPPLYTPDIALERFQMALRCAEIKRVRKSEIAYLELKISWVYRCLLDEVNERVAQERAYNGFVDALQNERFPIMEFDEQTLCYLLGEICAKWENKSMAKQWFSRVITRRDANPRIKQRIEERLPSLQEVATPELRKNT